MSALILDNIEGITADRFKEDTTDIAILGTDISFTYQHRIDIPDLKPGDYLHIWASFDDNQMMLSKWIGNDEEFIHHTNEFMKRVFASGRMGDVFRMVAVQVEYVDPNGKTFTCELMPRKPEPVLWNVVLDDKLGFDIVDA